MSLAAAKASVPLLVSAAIVVIVAAAAAIPVAAASEQEGMGGDNFFPDERDALMQIRDMVSATVDLHKNWTGPPCLEDKSRWFGITCSRGHIVRIVLEGIRLTLLSTDGAAPSLPPAFLHNITFLNALSFKDNSLVGPLPTLTTLTHLRSVAFSGNNFSGPIPFGYAAGLPRLEVLQLQENSLDGRVPPFAQPTLRVFNVSYNLLAGPIPDTPVLRRFPESSFDHNSGLCGLPLPKPCPPPPPPPPPAPPPIPSKEKNGRLRVWNLALIVVAAASLLPVLFLVVLLCYCRNSRIKQVTTRGGANRRVRSQVSRGDRPERMGGLEFFDWVEAPFFELEDLLRASAEMMGEGRLGTNYKASLESGSVVVVKRLKDMKGLGQKEFAQQMRLLGKTRHENLAQMLSFFYSKEEKLVVYEFVPGGSLFQLLRENRGGAARVPLNWSGRLSIIKGIAKGLAFLHQSLPNSHQKVPHGNLKSSNVLVQYSTSQNSYDTKLVDFGYLPLLPSRKSSEKLAIARSPEYNKKKLTEKADVYCFGIIILEVITGRSRGEEGDERDLSDWVRKVVNNDWSMDILDVEIIGARERQDEMLKLTEMALECTDSVPQKRPKITQVLRRIQEIEDMARLKMITAIH